MGAGTIIPFRQALRLKQSALNKSECSVSASNTTVARYNAFPVALSVKCFLARHQTNPFIMADFYRARLVNKTPPVQTGPNCQVLKTPSAARAPLGINN